MLFIPLPFVITLLFLLILGRLVRDGGLSSVLQPFPILTAGYALLSFVIGLRWGYGMVDLLPVMSLLAVSLPPLAWIAFRNIAGRKNPKPYDLLHTLPAALVVLQIAFWPDVIDWFVIIIQLAYGQALLLLAARGSDALTGATFEHAIVAHRMMIVVGGLLIISAGIDVLITIDFANSNGIHAARYVSAANLLGLLGFGLAAILAGRSQPANPSPDDDPPPPEQPSGEDQDLAARIEELVIGKQLYRDPDLTLNRLARKALVPARRISTAINRTRAESVSQFINGFRIREAQRLLAETSRPVTAIMFDSGFQTKSNFNREFLRRVGTSPAGWRSKHSQAPPP